MLIALLFSTADMGWPIIKAFLTISFKSGLVLNQKTLTLRTFELERLSNPLSNFNEARNNKTFHSHQTPSHTPFRSKLWKVQSLYQGS